MSSPIGKPFEYERNENGVELRWNLFSFAAFFLLLWLVPWTAACVVLTYTAVVKLSLPALLFSIPFWGFWILVARLFLDMLFARLRLRIDAHELRVDKDCLIWHREHIVPLAEVRKIEHHITTGGKGGKHHWIRATLIGRDPLDFSVLSGEYLDAVCRELNRDLRQFKTAELPDGETDAQTLFEPIRLDRHEARPEYPDPPKKTPWRLIHDDDGFTLRHRPVFKPFDLLLIGFMAMFWNGITWFFVLGMLGVFPFKNAPQGFAMGAALLFLSIFVLVGLLLLFAVINSVLEAFRITTWRFSLGQVEFQTRRPFSRREEVFPLSGWQTLLVRPEPNDDDNEDEDEEDTPEEPEFWELALLDAGDEELACIDELTKFEARWMADVVLQEQRCVGRPLG